MLGHMAKSNLRNAGDFVWEAGFKRIVRLPVCKRSEVIYKITICLSRETWSTNSDERGPSDPWIPVLASVPLQISPPPPPRPGPQLM